MKSIIPKEGTPTASIRGRAYYNGKKRRIDGVTFWLKGESPSDVYSQSPYNERAAYLVSRMLGFKLVPYTMLVLEKGKVASAQRWVRGKRPRDSRTALLDLFDYLIANSDRHDLNWLISRGRVRAIDNAYTFRQNTRPYDHYERRQDDLRQYIDKLLETERTELMQRLELVLADTQKLHKRFDCLLGEDRTNALIDRMKMLWGCRAGYR